MALDTMVEAKRRASISSPARSDDLDCTSSSADSSRIDDSTTPPPRRNSFPDAGETLRAPPVIPAVVGAPFSRHSLKFSIEKILSPEFGKTPKHAPQLEVGRTRNGLVRNHIHRAAVPPLSRTVPTSPTDFFSAVTGPPTPSNNNNRDHHRRVQPAESPNSNCSSVRPRSAGASTPETSQSPKLPSLAPQEDGESGKKGPILWPAWVYCTRYSDRPSSGPRSRRMKKKEKKPDEKRPRTAFTAEQLARLKQEFQENRYLTEKRRQDLAKDLKLNESQIKIWFQNKRAKIKKASGQRNPLALQLMAQGLYNHSTVPMDGEGEDDSMDKS